jgi:signal peptidase I
MEIYTKGFYTVTWSIIKKITPYVGIILLVIGIRMFIMQPFIVNGESMSPTFHTSDYLIIDELSYRLTEPQRGDVIVLRYPNNPKTFYLKRIIAKPGETISFKSGRVFITDTTGTTGELQEPYYNDLTLPGNDTTLTMGPSDYFVMGDNRNFSSDSRSWGLLDRKFIVGRPLLRLYPFSKIDTHPGSLDKFQTGE